MTCQPVTQPGPDVSFAQPSHTPHNPCGLGPLALRPSPHFPTLAQASKSPSAKTQIKIVAEAEFAIAKQLTKLQKRRAVYVEEFYGLDGC